MISNHTPAAKIVADNDDLLTEILLRLPIRSLLRFKSVSTHWLSLISNPSFSLLRNYRCPSPPITGLILHRSSPLINPELIFVPLNDDDDDPAKPPFRTLNFVNGPRGIRILQSCNGLLLCCCANECFNGKINYYIYNPTINKFITLPDPNRRVFRYIAGIESVCGVNLAFDPSKSPHYKAVCVYPSGTLPQHYEIEIYSSETRLWTPSGDPFHADVRFSLSVYWNGSIHWMSRLEGNSLYFNLSTECIQTMPAPPVSTGAGGFDPMAVQFLRESGGHLHLLALHGLRTTHFNIYEMEIDYSNWFVKYNVDLDFIPSAFPEMICSSVYYYYYYRLSVWDVIRGDKDEDSFLVFGIPGKAIRYNFVDKTFNKLYDFIADGSLYGWEPLVFQYIESLASV